MVALERRHQKLLKQKETERLGYEDKLVNDYRAGFVKH